jgi:hypothetical protein
MVGGLYLRNARRELSPQLPTIEKIREPCCDSSPVRLRTLWYRWAAKLLGWPQKRPEGHPHGFSNEVYEVLRRVVFPFPKVEQDAVGQRVRDDGGPCTCTI